MDAQHFDRFLRRVVDGGSRRGLLRHTVSLPLAGLLGERLHLGEAGAKKKRKKHRRKRRKRKTCGKPGSTPVKGK